MRGSDLLGLPVVDVSGAVLGPLRDLRIDGDERDGRLTVRWLVVGGREWAHRFGYIDGRTRGPWLLERLLRGSSDSAVAVAASAVAQWGPDQVLLSEPAGAAAVPVETAARTW